MELVTDNCLQKTLNIDSNNLSLLRNLYAAQDRLHDSSPYYLNKDFNLSLISELNFRADFRIEYFSI